MKTNHIIFLSLLVFAIALLSNPLPCSATEDIEENIWKVDTRHHKMSPDKRGKKYSKYGRKMADGQKTGRPRTGGASHTPDQILEWLKENYPEKAENLAKLREENPDLFNRQMRVNRRKYRRIAEVSKENPELANVLKQDLTLKEKRDKILRKIKAATDKKQKQQLISELQGVVGNRFDLLLKRRQITYEQMLKQLEKLKKEVKKHEAELKKHKDKDFKNKNVKARIQKLIERTEEFKWD